MGFSLFSKKSKEEKFWEWFSKNQSTYYSDIENKEYQGRFFNELSTELQKINPELVFDFIPIHKNGIREFTISAEGAKKIFPIVTELINQAPKLKNWQFNAFRQRIPGDNFSIKYDDIEIGYSDIYFRYSKDVDKIGVELNIRDYDGEGETQNAIYILLDGLIGEYDVTMGIGWIEWVKLDESNIDNLYFCGGSVHPGGGIPLCKLSAKSVNVLIPS